MRDNLARLRRKIVGFIYGVLSIVNRYTIHKEIILIYDPKSDKFDNTGALFDYLIENNYNKKYKIINICKNYKELSLHSINNVVWGGRIKGFFCFFSAKYVYYRSSAISIIPAKGQYVIQMWHGSPCKGGQSYNCRTDGWINPYYTGFLSASKEFNEIFSKVFSVPVDKMILCGHPRTDILFKHFPKYEMGEYKKLIIWTPTYRKYKKYRFGVEKQLKNDDKLLPIIPIGDFEEVNDYLKQKGVKVVIKLHPMQSLEKYEMKNLDFFVLLSDDDFKSKGMDLYRFMTQCDAMITDYSSIYWDFLALDRPIGFTEDDAEDYATGRGFVMDDPEKYKPGPKLMTKNDFYKFIDDTANDVDEYKIQRKEMNEYGNPVTDGNSCRRALECVGITRN